MVEFIVDRTSQDVARWKTLRDKGWVKMNAAERTEWLGEMKGRYAYTDMNRVERAVSALSARLVALGYLPSPLATKTSWTRNDAPTSADMVRYLGNIAAIRNSIAVYPTTPAAPSVYAKLNYSRANDLEQILLDVSQILDGLAQFRYYAGEIYAGEV